MTKRDFSMDAGRALAISLVTGFHLWRYLGQATAPVGAFDLYGVLSNGFVGVDVFFVLSGCAMMLTWGRQQGTWRDRALGFASARFLRIYPAYLVAVLLWCALSRAGLAAPVSLYDVVTHVTLVHTLDPTTFFSISGVFWSLAVEAHFYLLFPFLVMLPRWARLGTAVCGLAYTLFMTYALQGRADPATFALKWNVIGFLPLFVLGMEIPRLRMLPWSRTAAILGGIAAVAMMVHPSLVEPTPYPKQSALALIDRLIIGAGLGAFCLLALPQAVKASPLSRFIALIGVGSYSIYLYNYIFTVVPLPWVSGLPGAVAYTALVFGFGLTMWWLVERPAEWLRHSLSEKGSLALR